MAVNFIKKHSFKILLYHNISDTHKDPYAVTTENFKNQMGWIADNGYNVISLNQALKSLDDKMAGAKSKSLVLTFDDGFVDFFENAMPILNRYNFKSTVFVVASHVGNISGWRTQNLNKRLMDWGQLKTVTGVGHSVGSHGLNHYDLTKLSQKELEEETVVSKKIIQEKLGIKVDSFSYPWGKCTNRELRIVRQASYSCAVGVGGRWYNSLWANCFLLKRISIEQQDTIPTFADKLR